MTSSTAPHLTLAPIACGWSVILTTDDPHIEERTSFEEAVAAAIALQPKGGFPVTLVLPICQGIFERFTLPTVEPDEIAAMVRLQFEKLLPYPVEETEMYLQILHQSESESTVMACTVHEPALSKFCAPLLGQQIPERVTFAILELATLGPPDGVACCIWREGADSWFGIFENQSLGYVELVTGELSDFLPRALVRAAMAGARTTFESILLDPTLAELRHPVESALNSTVTIISKMPLSPALSADITPQQWKNQRTRRTQQLRLRRQLIASAMTYVTLLALGLIFLAIQQKELDHLHQRAAALRPKADAILERQQRWRALAPAIDPERYGVELLFQTWECLPSPDTRLNRFELSGDQLTIEGEAPNAQKAIAFGEALKRKTALKRYRFETAQPVLLPNEHAQFRIFGKP